MIVSKVGRRGQITIPRQVRRWLNLREKDRVAFIRRGNEIILHPLPYTLFDLRGSVPVPKPQDFTAVRHQVREEQARKVADGES